MACESVCQVLGNIAKLVIFMVWVVMFMHFCLIGQQKNATVLNVLIRFRKNILTSLFFTFFIYFGLYGLTSSNCEWGNPNTLSSIGTTETIQYIDGQVVATAYEDCKYAEVVDFPLWDLTWFIMPFTALYGLASIPLYYGVSKRK